MATNKLTKKTLIVGLGNLLLRDDGVGVHVIQALKENPPADGILADVGTSVLNALDLFEVADKIIVIDAMQGGDAAGSIYIANVDDINLFPAQSSLHQLSFISALKLLPPSNKQKEIFIIGIEPEVIEYGMDLSAVVKNAVPRVIDKLLAILQQPN